MASILAVYCVDSTTTREPWERSEHRQVKALLLSAYAAESHVYWQQGLAEMFPDWQWQLLSLPPRYFSWRVRGNPLYWALEQRAALEDEYDLLIATSMVDLATLRGLVPKLTTIPTVLYFHENQFDYPQDKQRHSLLEAQMVSLYSSLAADRIVFNSNYNQRSFIQGCDALLKRLPDKVPSGIAARLREKSLVLPVPVRTLAQDDSTAGTAWPGTQGNFPARPLRLLWVGRFEHDKGGSGLFLCLQELEKIGIEYELAMIGQQFRQSPAVYEDIERQFCHRLIQFGYLDSRIEYLKFLTDADIVLSTALHEFQGIAVLEAVAAGCVPVAPARLVYRDLFSPENCYPSLPEDPCAEATGAAGLLAQKAGQLEHGTAVIPDVSQFSSGALAPQYEAFFRTLLSQTRP